MAEETLKKAWNRPENLVKWAGLALLVLAGFHFLDAVLPTVIQVLDWSLEALWKMVLLGGSLAVVTWVVLSKDLHRLAWYGYGVGMTRLTSVFVNIDPIAIMQVTLRKLKEYFQELRQSLGDLRGQEKALLAKIEAKGRDYEHTMSIASQAMKRQEEKGMKKELVLQSRRAGRLEKSTMTYQALLNKIRTHIAVVEKVSEASEFMIEDITDTVEDETEKRAAIHAAYKAVSAAKRILLIGRDREMMDLALEANARDYNQKLGEIEQFMEDTKSAITSMDLDNGIFEEQAVDRLKEWETRSQALLEGGTGKTKFRVDPLPAAFKVGAPEAAEPGAPDAEKRQSFADLIDKL